MLHFAGQAMGRDILRPERIAEMPAVVMFTAPNPGPKTLDGTHTYLVGTHDGYLIDPGPELPAYGDALLSWLRANGVILAGILLTHAHPDHAPGAARLAEALGTPVWGAPGAEDQWRDLTAVDRVLSAGQTFGVEGDTLCVVDTPGHCPDHVVFWLARSRILFAGDTILGRGTSLIAPPEGNMAQYMQTLERLRRLDARTIAPGHGPLVRQPRGTIDAYITHRQERERGILEALADGPSTGPQLVARLYRDVDPQLHGLAAGSVEAQLIKLLDEGRVRREGDQWSLT